MMTPEEKAKQDKAVKDARQQEYDKKQDAAAEKARQYTLGGVKEEPVKKAKGGYVKAADGVAKRGKTRGRMC
jgi:hypothetical protein